MKLNLIQITVTGDELASVLCGDEYLQSLEFDMDDLQGDKLTVQSVTPISRVNPTDPMEFRIYLAPRGDRLKALPPPPQTDAIPPGFRP